MELNIRKAKYMISSNTTVQGNGLLYNYKPIDRINNFNHANMFYLSHTVVWSGGLDDEKNQREIWTHWNIFRIYCKSILQMRKSFEK